VENSHGNLRWLDGEKTNDFSCDDMDKCFKLTLEEVQLKCGQQCEYKVCIEYNTQVAGCPDYYEFIGRKVAGGTLDTVDACILPTSTPTSTQCDLSSQNVFEVGKKRCVIAAPDEVVRFSLKEGTEVCDDVNPKSYSKTYGSTTLAWKCGRNPVASELVRFFFYP
jgi:hypothetical protein